MTKAGSPSGSPPAGRVAEKASCNATTSVRSDPVLIRFKSVLQATYGDRLARIVLFGSRARGDARDGSDYDLAVFLEDLSDRWAELDRLADIGQTFLIEQDAFMDAKPFAATAWSERTPLMREIRLDGIDL